jgi:hypothetical protein
VPADIVFKTDTDMGYADITGQSERGEEFVEAYTALDLDAVDYGRITVPIDGLYAFRVRAREAGLTVIDGGVFT